MDEPWGHYAKWNELDRERQILYDLTNKCIPKQKKKKNPQNWAHTYREQTGQRWDSAGVEWECGWEEWVKLNLQL